MCHLDSASFCSCIVETTRGQECPPSDGMESMHKPLPQAIEFRLVEAAGRPNVSTDEKHRTDAAVDGLRPGRSALVAGLGRATPLAVVRPATTDEVAGVVR